MSTPRLIKRGRPELPAKERRVPLTVHVKRRSKAAIASRPESAGAVVDLLVEASPTLFSKAAIARKRRHSDTMAEQRSEGRTLPEIRVNFKE